MPLELRGLSSNAHAYRGLLVIPGLGRADRLSTVVHNLRTLERHYWRESRIKWSCIVYVYAAREVQSFWSNADQLSFVRSLCTIVEVPNKRVTENLYMVQPGLIGDHYDRVMILLDDCKIEDPQKFNLTKILRIMDDQQLTVASPMVRNLLS